MSAQVRSIADRNEALGLPAVQDPGPVYVTKEEASEAQSVEAMHTGGVVPKGGYAAQMQVRPYLFQYLDARFDRLKLK